MAQLLALLLVLSVCVIVNVQGQALTDEKCKYLNLIEFYLIVFNLKIIILFCSYDWSIIR